MRLRVLTLNLWAPGAIGRRAGRFSPMAYAGCGPPLNPLMSRPDWPFRRIDYILVRRVSKGSEPVLEVASRELVFDQPVDGEWASDHFGLLAELELLPAR